MFLAVEAKAGDAGGIDAEAISAALTDITKLRGTVDIVDAGSLPNDGKVISDERDYDA